MDDLTTQQKHAAYGDSRRRLTGALGSVSIRPKFERKGDEMKLFKLLLLMVLVVVLSAVVLQNQASWQVSFLWLTGEVPGIILLFLTAAAGFIAGITAALLVKRGANPKH
jgi:uncharacterized integral membrane protein